MLQKLYIEPFKYALTNMTAKKFFSQVKLQDVCYSLHIGNQKRKAKQVDSGIDVDLAVS